MRYFLNITGFKGDREIRYNGIQYNPDDRIEITKEEFELVHSGITLKWLFCSPYHVYPSMNYGNEHINIFEDNKLGLYLSERCIK